MRRYAPLHESGSHLDPGVALGEIAERIFGGNELEASFVHSNIDDEAAQKSAPEAQEAELGNQAARSAASNLKSIYNAVANWLRTDNRFERDNYFADTDYLVDPMQRLHHIERAGITRCLFAD